MKIIHILAILPLLTACQNSQPISASLPADTAKLLPALPGQPSIPQDLQDAAYNLDGSVAVGALPATDGAPGCVHGVLAQIGIDVVNNFTVIPPTETPVLPPAGTLVQFTPKINGLAGLGAVLYVRAQQAKALAGGGIPVPPNCKQLIGQLVIDGAANVKNGLPGGGLLPTFK